MLRRRRLGVFLSARVWRQILCSTCRKDISWHCDTCMELPEASREKRKNKADLWRFQSTWHFGDAKANTPTLYCIHQWWVSHNSPRFAEGSHSAGVQRSQESSAQVIVMPKKKTSYWINWIIPFQFKSLILFTYARTVLPAVFSWVI